MEKVHHQQKLNNERNSRSFVIRVQAETEILNMLKKLCLKLINNRVENFVRVINPVMNQCLSSHNSL